ncbi:hypothetical protein AURDEDRAFT_130409 [Auricularia subglabra TFB-10046 SS5]|uniref:Uncharacterized protein n=1 Tax=Auricularia subglabra (strain TFB-10046 / SS5) TaxID=717982 RepID=J0WTM1_AURST|nr:hypothetical protein AURDEDRAFT_130409 [Auricularia subglabra TFB-10046 SS5]
MPSFSLTSMVTALYEPVRIPADFAGLKGFNVYHATVPLHHSEIPVCIAHRTLRNRCPPGTIARVRGTVTVYGRTLLIVATTLIPAAIESAPGPLPPKYFRLPRFVFNGVVSSKISVLASNVECLIFDVTVARRDVWPGVPVTVSCWVHRDQKRFYVLDEIAEGTPVIITGVLCGWARDDKLMIDVHTLAYNNNGSPASVVATDAPNPFARALFKDGFAVFPFPTYDKSKIRSVLSLDALPSQVGMYVAASRDPRRAKVFPHSGEDCPTNETSISPADVTPARPDPVVNDTAEGGLTLLSNAAESLPPVQEVRAAAVKRVRARATRTRKSQRLSSPEVPLRERIKLKISAKQLEDVMSVALSHAVLLYTERINDATRKTYMVNSMIKGAQSLAVLDVNSPISVLYHTSDLPYADSTVITVQADATIARGSIKANAFEVDVKHPDLMAVVSAPYTNPPRLFFDGIILREVHSNRWCGHGGVFEMEVAVDFGDENSSSAQLDVRCSLPRHKKAFKKLSQLFTSQSVRVTGDISGWVHSGMVWIEVNTIEPLNIPPPGVGRKLDLSGRGRRSASPVKGIGGDSIPRRGRATSPIKGSSPQRTPSPVKDLSSSFDMFSLRSSSPVKDFNPMDAPEPPVSPSRAIFPSQGIPSFEKLLTSSIARPEPVKVVERVVVPITPILVTGRSSKLLTPQQAVQPSSVDLTSDVPRSPTSPKSVLGAPVGNLDNFSGNYPDDPSAAAAAIEFMKTLEQASGTDDTAREASAALVTPLDAAAVANGCEPLQPAFVDASIASGATTLDAATQQAILDDFLKGFTTYQTYGVTTGYDLAVHAICVTLTRSQRQTMDDGSEKLASAWDGTDCCTSMTELQEPRSSVSQVGDASVSRRGLAGQRPARCIQCYGDALDPFYILDRCSATPVSEFANSPASEIPIHLLPLYVWFKNPFVGHWLPCVKCASDGRVYIESHEAWIEKSRTLALNHNLAQDLPFVRQIIHQVGEENLKEIESHGSSELDGHRSFFQKWYTSSLALVDELQALI